jgi:pimeloyl-ACP methyl ester carboxylesterase
MLNYIKEKNNNKNIVLFIHGFTSNNDTWVNSKGKSFPSMLLENEIIRNNFDVAYVSYATELSGFYKTKASLSVLGRFLFGTNTVVKKSLEIKQLSDYIATTISLNCSEYEYIIIVAHSMGGLVSKGYILKDLERNKVTKVKLLLSLAVPHNGSNWANVGEKLFKNNKQIIDMVPLSQALTDLTNKWLWQEEGLPDTAYLIAQHDEVVDSTSSTGFEKTRQSEYFCQDNHFSIAKPEEKNTNCYLTVEKYLIQFIQKSSKLGQVQKREQSESKTTISVPTSSQVVDLNERRERINKALTEIHQENERIFKQYGPLSVKAQHYPISELAYYWKEKCKTDIIPNNRKILSILEENKQLIPMEKLNILEEYKNHLEVFEINHTTDHVISDPPTFPSGILNILYKDGE